MVKVAVHPDGQPGSGDLKCLILVEGQSYLEIGCHVYVDGPIASGLSSSVEDVLLFIGQGLY